MFDDQIALSIYKGTGYQAFNSIYRKHSNGSLHSSGDMSFLFDSFLSVESQPCQREAAAWPHSSPNYWKYPSDKY